MFSGRKSRSSNVSINTRNKRGCSAHMRAAVQIPSTGGKPGIGNPKQANPKGLQRGQHSLAKTVQ